MNVVKGIVSALAIGFILLVYALALPTLSLAYFGGFFFISMVVFIVTALICMWISDEDEFRGKPLGIVTIIILLITIAVATWGSPLRNSATIYNQIGKVVEKDFREDVVEIDTSQIPVVDLELAAKLADKKLGEDLALGSQMHVGTFTNKQQVNGKLVYVAPLEHNGFFKWNSNKSGTVGYVIVSATNPNDVKLVKEVNDKSLHLKYLSSAYFSNDLTRHLRNSGYRNIGLSEPSFELDDDGTPYWVVSTYKNATAWANPEVTGVIVCDPQTGKCEWYSVEDAPDWIDIIQTEDYIKNQIKNYGKYVHGAFNFSGKDQLTMTEHITTVYNNGNCYYYTGLSSAGADNGTVGFIMVNTRDKSATLYRMVGATEDAAMRSAEGKVQNMGYKATTPIPLNVSGIPTYFCTLKDSEGLVKQYAMLNIEDYSIVANGNTIMEAKRAYINAVNNSGSSVDFGAEAYGYSVTGIVTRIGSNIENGNTYYYLILDGDDTKLYLASYMISEELPITREGDKVEVSYVDESNGTINIITFDNIGFAQDISEKQQQLNSEQESNNILNDPDNKIIEVNPEENQEAWDNLSEKEKAKLIDSLPKENE